MSNRIIQEINAGSMADIAFLLLIFFLVTTTMDVDHGILTKLHPLDVDVPRPAPVPEYKVFKILVNQQDELLVEDTPMTMEQLKEEAKLFLSNGGVFSDKDPVDSHVEREHWLSENELMAKIALRNGRDYSSSQDIKRLEAQLDAVRYFGPYKELDKSAVISFQMSKNTSYNTFIQLSNELSSAVNELRDQLSVKHFSKPYLELDSRIPMEKRQILALRQVYPQRVIEAEPSNY